MFEECPGIEIIHSAEKEICYIANMNVICFGKIGHCKLDAEDVVLLLNHEIFHWAQDFHLTKEEIAYISKKQHEYSYYDRFIEYTNPYFDDNVSAKLRE
jgi:hypothetical protein